MKVVIVSWGVRKVLKDKARQYTFRICACDVTQCDHAIVDHPLRIACIDACLPLDAPAVGSRDRGSASRHPFASMRVCRLTLQPRCRRERSATNK